MSETGKAQFCPKCGTPRMEGANFCPKCGHRFADASVTLPPVDDTTTPEAPTTVEPQTVRETQAARETPTVHEAQAARGTRSAAPIPSVALGANTPTPDPVPLPTMHATQRPLAAPAQMPPSFVPQAQAEPTQPEPQENDFGETEILPPQQFGVTQEGVARPGSVRPGAVQDGVAQPISIRPERVEQDGQSAGQPRIAQETGDIAPWGVTAEEREAAHEAAQEAAREAAREAVPGAQTEHGRHTPYIAAQPVYDVQPLESLVARTEAITAAREEERAREDAEAETTSGQAIQEPNGDENLISAEAARAPLANRNREAAAADAEPVESAQPADSATTNASPNDDDANDAGEATTAFDPLAALAEEEAQEAEQAAAVQNDAESHAAGDEQAPQPTQQPVSFAPAQPQSPTPVPVPAPASIPEVNENATDSDTVNNNATDTNAIDDDTVPSQSDIDDDTVLSEPEIDDRTVVSDVASGSVSTATPDAASAPVPTPSPVSVPDDNADTPEAEDSLNIDEDPTRTVEETTAFNPLEWFDDGQEELEQPKEPETSDEETTVIPPAAVPTTTALPTSATPTSAVPAPIPPTTALPQHDDHATGQQSPQSEEPSPSEEQPTQAIPANQLKPLLAGAAAVAGTAAAGVVAQQASAAENIPKTTAIPLPDTAQNLPNNDLSNEKTLENPAEETVVIGPSKAAPEPVNTPAPKPSADSTTVLGNPATAANEPADQQPVQPQAIQPTGRVARSATSSIAQPESDPSQPTVQSSTRPSILAPTGSAQAKPESALDELAQFAVPDDEDDDLFPMSDRSDRAGGNRSGDAAAETAIYQPQGGAAPAPFAPGAGTYQYGGQQYQQYGQPNQPNQYGQSSQPGTYPAYAGYGNANAAGGPGARAGVPGLPTPNGPNGPQGPAGQNPSNAPKPKRKGKGKRVAAIVAAVICVIAIAASGGGYFWWTNQQHQTALSACTNAQSEFDKSATTLSSSITKGKQAASGTQYDEVNDQNDLTGLNNLVNTTTDDGSSESCNADRTTAELNSSADKFKALAKTNLTLASKIDNAVTTLKSSKANKTLADAKSALESTLSKAKELMTSATGNVTDESTLTALQQAISDANTMLQSLTTDSDTSKITASSLNKAAETLETAMDKVNASVKAKQAADDKTRCQNIAGNYGMWQGSMQLTVNSDCSISMQDAGTPSGSSGAYSYTTNSYKENGDGTITWTLSNNETMTYYPSGTQSPSIKKFVDALGNGETDPTVNMPKLETGDGSAYVG
ncbi:hypothetical protein BTIS_1396 [Bifidobacterium tissieri]|uniref:Zinc-ribbon domain-containing protein n=2 Tax=Bifidobacterium tissieri TaxID=1630162 RepID=A0A261FDU9_9BIFI|nr:hypothetical protein BTIS_1396 [Bifidobacterium tissieri]